MYNLNGYDYSLEEVQEAAEAAGMELQEYLLKNGMNVSPDKFLAGGQPNTERPEDRGFFEALWLATTRGLATGSGVAAAFAG